jgi:hypothetical protein
VAIGPGCEFAMILGVVTGTGGGVCLALRLVAAWQHWGLSRAGAI